MDTNIQSDHICNECLNYEKIIDRLKVENKNKDVEIEQLNTEMLQADKATQRLILKIIDLQSRVEEVIDYLKDYDEYVALGVLEQALKEAGGDEKS